MNIAWRIICGILCAIAALFLWADVEYTNTNHVEMLSTFQYVVCYGVCVITFMCAVSKS